MDMALPQPEVGECGDTATLSSLRLAVCGSVDDGKSTLLGRLLFDADLVMEDQLAAITSSGRTAPDGAPDLSWLLDGLLAEREQGITIDVAYRYFSTARRAFIVADCPGHDQYTRNMATAASNTDATIVLIDASKGVLTQTRRHLLLLSLFGVRSVLVVVNKMDLVGFDRDAFRRIADDCSAASRGVGFASIVCIPACARTGENIVRNDGHLEWHDGPTVLSWIENVDAAGELSALPFRMPVQSVLRDNGGFRGHAGLIVGGTITVGDEIVAQPSGARSRVKRIVVKEGDRPSAQAGQSVALVFEPPIDAGRGAVIGATGSPPDSADHFHTTLVWFDDTPMVPGRSYLMRIGTALVPATVSTLRHRIDVNSLEHVAARRLERNDIGVCNLATDQIVAFDPYTRSRDTGAFILIDTATSRTVGAGMIDYALRRSTNVAWQPLSVGRAARAALKRQKPAILWLTGYSGAGKSTIANLIDRRLSDEGHHSFVLDGDNLRHGLNRDLGFTVEDRVENIRRVAEVARLMAEAGLIVIVALISPFARERGLARRIAADVNFLEIFIDAPLEVCKERDPKGLYAAAAAGRIQNFTGVDSPYEPPEAPDLRLDTSARGSMDLADQIMAELAQRGIV